MSIVVKKNNSTFYALQFNGCGHTTTKNTTVVNDQAGNLSKEI